jgi:hypothetical protein
MMCPLSWISPRTRIIPPKPVSVIIAQAMVVIGACSVAGCCRRVGGSGFVDLSYAASH